jgi:hypothetical protein
VEAKVTPLKAVVEAVQATESDNHSWSGSTVFLIDRAHALVVVEELSVDMVARFPVPSALAPALPDAAVLLRQAASISLARVSYCFSQTTQSRSDLLFSTLKYSSSRSLCFLTNVILLESAV